MKVSLLVLALALLASPACAEVIIIIKDDHGGVVADYIEKYDMMAFRRWY